MFATKFQNAHRVYNRQDTSNFSNTIQILKLVGVSHITQIDLLSGLYLDRTWSLGRNFSAQYKFKRSDCYFIYDFKRNDK